MDNRLRLALGSLSVLCLTAGSPSGSKIIPEWLVGDWTPVDVRQNPAIIYPSKENEPKHWLAGQHLVVTANSLTLADDRCVMPTVSVSHGRPNVLIREKGAGTIQTLGLNMKDDPIEYLSLKCEHDLLKTGNGTGFVHDRTIQIAWYAIVHSHTEIDMPFFGGAYVKFKKTAPTA